MIFYVPLVFYLILSIQMPYFDIVNSDPSIEEMRQVCCSCFVVVASAFPEPLLIMFSCLLLFDVVIFSVFVNASSLFGVKTSSVAFFLLMLLMFFHCCCSCCCVRSSRSY